MINRLKQIDDDIIRDYDYFYGNYDEDHDDTYEDEIKYSGHIGRELYSGDKVKHESFETYKNMFESENLIQSKEQIDDTIDGLNNWFEKSDFGEDLPLPKSDDPSERANLPKFPHFPIIPEKSGFNRKKKNTRRNFNRNIRGSYKNDERSDGRSFGISNKLYRGPLNNENVKIPSNVKSDRMVNDQDKQVIEGNESNLVPMKMNNNNLQVPVVF